MRKTYLLVFIVVVCILLLGCAVENKLRAEKTDAEEVGETLDQLKDLDVLSEGVENISFDDVENVSLE